MKTTHRLSIVMMASCLAFSLCFPIQTNAEDITDNTLHETNEHEVIEETTAIPEVTIVPNGTSSVDVTSIPNQTSDTQQTTPVVSIDTSATIDPLDSSDSTKIPVVSIEPTITSTVEPSKSSDPSSTIVATDTPVSTIASSIIPEKTIDTTIVPQKTTISTEETVTSSESTDLIQERSELTQLELKRVLEHGFSAEDPLVLDGSNGEFIIVNGSYYGISKQWFIDNNPTKETLYLSIKLPNTITTIANDGLRSSYSSDKKSNGVINVLDNLGDYIVVNVDFSNATNLERINAQAAMNQPISGVLDLSNTKVTHIGKSAFNGCKQLTGVILPNTLQVLGEEDGSAGSVFNECTGLQFIRTAGSNLTFELPSSLRVIGKQSFKNTFANGSNLMIHIPASVEIIGSEAFYSNSAFKVIFIDRFDSLSGYDSGAFKATSTSDALLILNNAKQYNEKSYTRIVKTYPVTLQFLDEHNDVFETQYKLYGQSIRYEFNENNQNWYINSEYTLPKLSIEGSAGYLSGWTIEGSENTLTDTSTVKGNVKDILTVTAQFDVAVELPTIKYTINGKELNNSTTTNQYLTVEIDEDHPALFGVSVTHPLATQQAIESGTYVYFKYVWWDLYNNSVKGPRSIEQPDIFSSEINDRKFTDVSSIQLRDINDQRTSPNYYLVEVYGFYVENNGIAKQFFKSKHNFIGVSDTGTTNLLLAEVEIVDTTKAIVSPTDIQIYTGGKSYPGIVDENGTIQLNNGFPEPGYQITLPEYISDLLDKANIDDLTDCLTFIYDDGTINKTWNIELYGKDNNSSISSSYTDRDGYIYRIVSQEGSESVKILVKDEDGSCVTNDKFDFNIEDLYKEYRMTIFTNGIDISKVKAIVTINNQNYEVPLEVNEGRLIVIGVKDATTTRVGDVDSYKPSISNANAYYIFDTNVILNDSSGVHLLVDQSLIRDELIKQIKNIYDNPSSLSFESYFLDLVDVNNGNVRLSFTNTLDVYWPIPKDYKTGGKVSIFHFENIDRHNINLIGEMGNFFDSVKEIVPEIIKINGLPYLKFAVSSLSPFVLVFEKVAKHPSDNNPNNSNDDSKGVWDDGGPFTTDKYGNVYDRWGNLIWRAPKEEHTYQLVNTSDR